MGPWSTRLTDKLNSLEPTHLELRNESHMHRRPPEAESHFRAIIASPRFAGLSRVARHRLVMDAVAAELREHVHALGVQAFTPEEWVRKGGETFASPTCRGGGGGGGDQGHD